MWIFDVELNGKIQKGMKWKEKVVKRRFGENA